MEIFEIISAIVLIIACVFIVIVVLMSDTKSGMSQAISGASSDSFYQKNSGRTKEAKLNRAMVVSTVIFFVLAFAVNIINVYANKAQATGDQAATSGVTSTVTTDTDSAADAAATTTAPIEVEPEAADTSSQSDADAATDTSAATE
ncbi:MAG: preprotein translocase subunit SecG [Ruminococcaceae bacterium]|nr:preprotein translocase subunit SecG [Oscillospiraceae bacterium]